MSSFLGNMAEFIWNGVGLTAPDTWEPTALERDGLTLDAGGQPACELKWRRVVGTFSFAKHLKRLTREHKSVDMHGVPDNETPPVWSEAISRLAQSGIRSQSFIWQTPTHKGIGAALHNPGTGLAVLVQFFVSPDAEKGVADEKTAAETLATFRDYSGGRTIPWLMFGLTARLPAEFVLDTFSFQPGHYMIRFWRPKTAKQADKLAAGKGAGVRLVFQRFAPASVLLKGHKDLAQWVAKTLDDAPPVTVPMASASGVVTWSDIAKTSLLRALLRRQVHTQGRVWTTDSGNAILSIIATGSIPVPETVFSEIHTSYGLV